MTSLRTSSLALGPIGHITAWTKQSMKPTAPYAFGYAYRYSEAGAWPAGAFIDADTGLISTTSAIAEGTYSIGVKAAQRKKPALASSFAVMLQVDRGVTANRSGNQILHKTYDPHSGTYGQPAGNDFTAVFNKINEAILNDQEAAGMDDNLRCSIPLRGGARYEYKNNRWACGAQFIEIYQSTTGAKPQLVCTCLDYNYDIEAACIQAGGGSVFDFYASNPASKTWTALIGSCGPGDTKVTLKNSIDASKLRSGRWHMVCSYDQQAEGGPPNCRYYDYVIVKGVSGATVDLDRPLRHKHSDTYWETFPQNDFSFGRARIVPMDVGGAGGVENGGTKSKVRLTQRGIWRGLEFVTNPNYPARGPKGDIGTFAYEDGLEIYFEDCVIPYAVPSITKHVVYKKCNIPMRMEMDKLTETLTVDECDIGGEGIGSSTGVEHWLIRDSTVSCCSSSPRQMRSIRTTWDIQKSTNLEPIDDMSLLVSPGIPGPIHLIEFEGSTWKAQNGPAYNPGTIYPRRDITVWSATIGTDLSWNNNRLIIPRSSAQFVNILGYVFEGMIVTVGNDPHGATSWGYVTNITSPGDGTAQWIDITWVKGTKPTSGVLGFCRNHAVDVSDDNVLGNAWTRWHPEGTFFRQQVPAAWGQSYDWPAGYPFTGFF